MPNCAGNILIQTTQIPPWATAGLMDALLGCLARSNSGCGEPTGCGSIINPQKSPQQGSQQPLTPARPNRQDLPIELRASYGRPLTNCARFTPALWIATWKIPSPGAHLARKKPALEGRDSRKNFLTGWTKRRLFLANIRPLQAA